MLLVLEEDKQINVYVTHTQLEQGSEHEAPTRICNAENSNLSLLVGYFSISLASLYKETVKMEEITSAECNRLGKLDNGGGV